MRIEWQTGEEDAERVRALVARQRDNAFVKMRIERNLSEDKPAVSKSAFWECAVMCLLTTQQRASPGSPVQRFMRTQPFPLAYEACRSHRQLEPFARETLMHFGGIRRSNTIAREVATNLPLLEGHLWDELSALMEHLRAAADPECERRFARRVAADLAGFGPKQSRNLMQSLGLSRHEIPIDSRITKWLNAFGFPIRLSAVALADPEYYQFVSDGIQALCEKAGVYPCVLDAAIFASFDGDKWTDANVIC